MISADLERQIMNRLVVVSTTRDFELQNLFEFEPSTVLSSRFNTDGTISKCNKSQLLREMEKDFAVKELADFAEESLHGLHGNIKNDLHRYLKMPNIW